jgi:hypothetical protein
VIEEAFNRVVGLLQKASYEDWDAPELDSYLKKVTYFYLHN